MQELWCSAHASSMDHTFQNAELPLDYAGVEDGSAVNVGPLGDASPREDADPLSSQIRHLLGGDLEIDSLFFETLWRTGLRVAIEELAVRNAEEERVHRSESREEPRGEPHPFFSFDGFGLPMWIQPPVSSANSTPDPPTVGSAVVDPVCLDPALDPVLASQQEMYLPVTEQSACRILKVSPHSTPTEIRAAYHSMASQWHPDRAGAGSQFQQRLANEQMAAINAAYHLLRTSPTGLR